MLTEERTCKFCNKLLKKDMRKDAMFCNTYCRTAFNNLRRFGSDPEVSRVDKILHKNLEILKQVIKDKRYAEVSKKVLDKSGFKFDYCTFSMGSYKYCYHLSYKEIEGEKFQITIASANILEKMKE